LSQAEESGSARREIPTTPLLLEYSAQGQLLWMSDQTSCGLANLEGALLRQYFRLEKAERALATGAAARPAAQGKGRQRAGIKAQRQVELERQRLGRDLHTGVGQMLAAMRLQLEVVTVHLPEPPEAVRHALDRLSVLLREALEQVRGLSRRLHPPAWQALTMEEAFRQLWELSGIPQSLEALLRIEPLPQQPDLPIKVLVYRTVQEALSNLTRHARATRVEGAMESRDGRLLVTIQDNGIGFDVKAMETASASLASGIGLRSMVEQAASLDATLDVESGPNGTKLILSAPFSLEGS
jgi:signal transduction histidine kinase